MIGITKFNPLRAKADSFGFRRGYFLKSKKMNNTVLQVGSFSITKEQLRQLTDPKRHRMISESNTNSIKSKVKR